jgi:hypothetical protein
MSRIANYFLRSEPFNKDEGGDEEEEEEEEEEQEQQQQQQQRGETTTEILAQTQSLTEAEERAENEADGRVTSLLFHHIQRDAFTDALLEMRQGKLLFYQQDLAVTGEPDAMNAQMLAAFGVTFHKTETSPGVYYANLTYTGVAQQ